MNEYTIEKKRFSMKYNFYENDIKKDAIVEYITNINEMCLVEDVETKKEHGYQEEILHHFKKCHIIEMIIGVKLVFVLHSNK